MQFQVPQYIEVEDQIFGSLTARQFIYIAGSAGLFFLIFTMAPLWVALLLGGPIGALGLALAFYKVNNRPLVTIIESAVTFAFGSRLYVWKQQEKKTEKTEEKSVLQEDDLFVPKLSDSKLKDLAWSLDIQESIYSDESQR